MYRSGPNFESVEKHVPKYGMYTEMVMYTELAL